VPWLERARVYEKPDPRSSITAVAPR
jgi:hypothetical protein